MLRVRGLVVDLIAATRTELDRAMRACGWMPCRWADSEVYERPVPAPFVLRAQFWINGAPVALECTVWIACEAADEALGELGEDDVETWVSRDPFDRSLKIELRDQVQTVVSEAVTRIRGTVEQMRAYLSIDAFTAELAANPETRESAPVAVAVVLAVTGRTRDARERAGQVPGDFANRLERWLAGERPPPLWESEDDFSWGEAFTTAFRKAREVTPEERAQRPQSSWRDVWRTARTLRSALHGELPARPRLPDRERAWHDVELNSDAACVLERAHRNSPLVIFVAAFVEVSVEPGTHAGRLRVLIDGVEIGSLSAPDDATPAAAPARLRRTRPGAPLTLAVQLPDPGIAAHD